MGSACSQEVFRGLAIFLTSSSTSFFSAHYRLTDYGALLKQVGSKKNCLWCPLKRRLDRERSNIEHPFSSTLLPCAAFRALVCFAVRALAHATGVQAGATSFVFRSIATDSSNRRVDGHSGQNTCLSEFFCTVLCYEVAGC